ncbi:hypothetical protein CKF54_00880 [Psittacicella hinzii]|uniref:Uncharacterized protein n=1 Tax=Psittacicella hinzii TaxID=2028575 RepID=A0A3A1YDX1_9GAMM|nr:hypothetical protein [Psittacicella hinzii]RIY34327.1 hypothetical protein CKF54_00880 [Psittacicella hinzii]
MIIFEVANKAMSQLIRDYSNKYNVQVSTDVNRYEPVNRVPLTLYYKISGAVVEELTLGNPISNNCQFVTIFRLSKAKGDSKSINMYMEALFRMLRAPKTVSLENLALDTVEDVDLEIYKKYKYRLVIAGRTKFNIDNDKNIEHITVQCEFKLLPVNY